jgi:hypothetical protein
MFGVRENAMTLSETLLEATRKKKYIYGKRGPELEEKTVDFPWDSAYEAWLHVNIANLSLIHGGYTKRQPKGTVTINVDPVTFRSAELDSDIDAEESLLKGASKALGGLKLRWIEQSFVREGSHWSRSASINSPFRAVVIE